MLLEYFSFIRVTFDGCDEAVPSHDKFVMVKLFHIEVGKSYKTYKDSDLKRRVWELERAVWQLQRRVFELEGNPRRSGDVWVCTMNVFSKMYTGTGASRAVAKLKVIEACKKGNNGNGFHCTDARCEM